MPYSPVQINNPGLAPGIDAVSGLVQDWQKKRKRQEEQDATNQVLYHTLSTSADATGNPLLSDEEHAKFLSGNSNQRSGIIAAGMSRLAQTLDERRFRASEADSAAQRALQWKIANLRNAPDPNEGRPIPLTLPDGTPIDGRFYIPGARQVIDTTRGNGGPPPGLFIPPGWVWNGRELVQQRSQQQDDLAQLDALNRRNRSQAIDQQLVDAESEIAAGNVRPGPDWLPLTTRYAVRAKKLEAQRRQLLQPEGATAAPAATPSQPPTPTGKVRVRHPNGQIGFIPAAQLQSAIANGYQQIP